MCRKLVSKSKPIQQITSSLICPLSLQNKHISVKLKWRTLEQVLVNCDIPSVFFGFDAMLGGLYWAISACGLSSLGSKFTT